MRGRLSGSPWATQFGSLSKMAFSSAAKKKHCKLGRAAFSVGASAASLGDLCEEASLKRTRLCEPHTERQENNS